MWTRTNDGRTPAVADRVLALLGSTSDPDRRRAAIARELRLVRPRGRFLLTAYYEPELPARLARDGTFHFPLYGRPPDLVDVDASALDADCRCRRLAGRLEDGRVRPYPTRAEIDAGVLAGRGLEVAWAADPVGVFVLHVQGSGRLRLDDGRVVGARYAGTNGRRYGSVARALAERGLLPHGGSLPEIRRALAALPPEEQMATLGTNERYTFFRLADGAVTGSVGVELTPGRSIAVDPRVIPPGSLAYLVTPSIRRFVVAQDTGAAITGAHADLFLGAGAEAEARAGTMHERGTLYLVVPG